MADIRKLLVNEDEPTVILNLEDGTDLECAVLTIFEVDGQEYMALFPLDGEGEDDIIIYRYQAVDAGSDEEDLDLTYIEDDEEYERVSDYFDMLLDDADYEDAFGDLDE